MVLDKHFSSVLKGDALNLCGLVAPCNWEEGSGHCEKTSTYSHVFKPWFSPIAIWAQLELLLLLCLLVLYGSFKRPCTFFFYHDLSWSWPNFLEILRTLKVVFPWSGGNNILCSIYCFEIKMTHSWYGSIFLFAWL